jgi:hypothetical protein
MTEAEMEYEKWGSTIVDVKSNRWTSSHGTFSRDDLKQVGAITFFQAYGRSDLKFKKAYVSQSIGNRMIDYMRKEMSRRVFDDCPHHRTSERPEVYGPSGALSKFGDMDDPSYVVKKVLSDDIQVSGRTELCQYLHKKEGWTYRRIRAAFDEIKQRLHA